MGKTEIIKTIPFTKNDIMNKDLIIQMLKFEDIYGKSDEGQKLYSINVLNPRTSLEPIYFVHRHVLSHFGFDTSDSSVENYRNIFRTYYKSPTDYDKDVIESVYYMKNNKCVFYTLPKPQTGQQVIDCNILKLDGTQTTLLNELSKLEFNKCFVGAFSNS